MLSWYITIMSCKTVAIDTNQFDSNSNYDIHSKYMHNESMHYPLSPCDIRRWRIELCLGITHMFTVYSETSSYDCIQSVYIALSSQFRGEENLTNTGGNI